MKPPVKLKGIVKTLASTKNIAVVETPAERRFRWVFTAGLWILGIIGLAMIGSTVVYGWQYS
jgi:hypothetical protein